MTRVSFEVQVTSVGATPDEDAWVTIDYLEPEQAAVIPVREEYLRKFQEEFGRGQPVRIVQIETRERLLAERPATEGRAT